MLSLLINAVMAIVLLIMLGLFGASVWIVMPMALVIGVFLGGVFVMCGLDVGSDL